MRRLWSALPIFAFALIALFPTLASSQEDARRPAAEAMKKQFSYYVRDGGMWKQMNDEHVPGDGSPVMWAKRIGFEMTGDLLVDRTYAVFEDKSCRPIATIFQSAELNTGRFRTVAYAENGIQFTGIVTAIDDHSTERVAEGQVNAKTRIKFREITDMSDPDRYLSQMYNPDGEGGWTLRDTASWDFDPSLDLCN